jgi:molecular chaperone GrpE
VTDPSEQETDYDPDKVVFRDKRRIDPSTGELREPADTPPAPVADAVPDREAELLESLARTQAEYANYRKRVDRDRQVEAERARATVVVGLLPMLDDIERAREHGDLTGGFKSVGEALEALTLKLGLERFGAADEPFDPTVHEAVMQAEPDDSSPVAVCAQVFQQGFRLSGLVLRPARVSVAEGTGEPVPEPEEE